MDFEALFNGVMRLDEAEDARSVEEDVKEWWGMAEGIPCERSGEERALATILDELRALETGSASRRARICWLAAEPGSGTTLFLHILAYRAAREGFPTLVAKQTARDPIARQLTDFLTNLHEVTREIAGADYVEKPVLLVLDVPHERTRRIEDLPDQLVRTAGRRVLTLRAVRIPVGTPSPGPGSDRADWLAEQVAYDDLDRRLPFRNEPVVAVLRSHPEDVEIQRIEEKARLLREHRHLDLEERTRETWLAFQRSHRFHVETLLRNAGLNGAEFEEAKREFDSEPLFWVLLYYFLRRKGPEDNANPLASGVGRRLARLTEIAERAGLASDQLAGVLLETAKTSAWGVAVPLVALADWTRSNLCEQPDSGTAASFEGRGTATDSQPRLTAEEMPDALARLREWASGRTARAAGVPRSPEDAAHRSVDWLAHEGLLRRGSIKGIAYATVPHPVLARHILLEALGGTQPITRPLRESIGGVRAIYFKEQAFQGLKSLLSSLTATASNLQLAQDLSERLLLGDDDSPEWRDGRGEARLAAYALIPEALRRQSRVLSHHWGLLLRRSTFLGRLAASQKIERLLVARESLLHALSLPWLWGERSEHPAHIRTTLGLVADKLADLDRASAARWRSEARDELRSALLDLPDSRHTRLALARVCLDDAARILDSESPRDCRRLHSLRGWGDGTQKQVLAGGPGAGRSDGFRA